MVWKLLLVLDGKGCDVHSFGLVVCIVAAALIFREEFVLIVEDVVR